mgnify:CR=1 FL=1
MDTDRLASVGVSLEAVRTAITQANVNLAKGNLDGPARATAIDANDQLRQPTDYADLVLAYRNGNALRLGDVAHVEFVAGLARRDVGLLGGDGRGRCVRGQRREQFDDEALGSCSHLRLLG